MKIISSKVKSRNIQVSVLLVYTGGGDFDYENKMVDLVTGKRKMKYDFLDSVFWNIHTLKFTNCYHPGFFCVSKTGYLHKLVLKGNNLSLTISLSSFPSRS
jgi:hypothetical protein